MWQSFFQMIERRRLFKVCFVNYKKVLYIVIINFAKRSDQFHPVSFKIDKKCSLVRIRLTTKYINYINKNWRKN